MMTEFEQLLQEVETAKVEHVKFYEKGNKAAGTRLRLSLQAISKLCKSIRKDVQDKKNETTV